MKVALISGISKGIGRALAERFSLGGYRVAGCARTRADLDALQKERPSFVLEACDLSKREQARAYGKRIVLELGPPDVLVNNAGRFVPGLLHQQGDEDTALEEMIAANLLGPYYLTRAVLPGMMARRSGAIVNMASVAATGPYLAGSAYSVSKFGLLGFSTALRAEMKPYDIRVISVLPGATYTPAWEGAGLPKERFIAPEDLAELVFCACALKSGAVVEELLVRPQLGDI